MSPRPPAIWAQPTIVCGWPSLTLLFGRDRKWAAGAPPLLSRPTAIIDSHSIPASFNLLGAHQWKPPTFEARDLWLRCFKALWNVSPQKRCGLEVEELAVLSALLLHGKDVRAESLNGFIQAG